MRTSPKKKNQLQTNKKGIPYQSSQQKIKEQLQKSRNMFQKTHDKLSRSARRRYSIKAYHFSNGIYQGQMRSFHHTGRGLFLHDNGMTGIIQSGSNRLKDHNIFLGQNIIISVLYKQHEIEFVYKNDQKILVLTMQKKNNAFLIKYPGFLIQLDQNFVFKLRFKNNKLVDKVALTLAETDEIIGKENFGRIIGPAHIQALKFNFYDNQSPEINVIQKNNGQLHVGYVQTSTNQYLTTYQVSYSPNQSQNHQLHGLGLVLQKRDFNPNKQFYYTFNILSRGFYSHGRLQYFGEIYYQNGNHYFGRIREQKMHGNGLLVYEKERRFVFGQFYQGKPLKLDENLEYRLDTQQGRNLYQSLRKRLHGQDPQVWIDNQVHDQPSAQYFLKQLKECINFRYQDQQINIILKKEEQLWLSRKVEDFQQQNNPLNKRTLTGRLSNTLYDRNNYLTQQYMLNLSRRQDQAVRRQIQVQEIRRSRSKLKELQKLQISTFRPSKRDTQLNQTPIQKIRNFQHRKSQLENPQINQSIINNFTFSADKNLNQIEKINTSSSKKQSPPFSNIINFGQSEFSGSKIDINEELQNYQFLQPNANNPSRNQVNIKIHSPIEKNSFERSLSRSMSRSSKISSTGSRSISRSYSGQRSKISYVQPQEKVYLKSNKKRAQKTSIIDKLYSEANLRAQKLEKQYEMLQKSNKNRTSPYKNLSMKPYVNENVPSLSPRKRQAFDFSPLKNNQVYCQPFFNDQLINNFMKEQQQIKCLVAANEALRLGNSNRIKQQKYLQYDHFTHKKRFDYTSDAYENIRDKRYQISGTYGSQYKRTPEKSQQFNRPNITDSQKTVRKEKIDSVVSRLYPHQVNSQSPVKDFQTNKVYDSSYEQSRQLNKIGRTRQDDRTINFQEPVYKYTSGLKNSVLKHNVFVKS